MRTRSIGGAFFLVAAAAAGCNAILGIEEYPAGGDSGTDATIDGPPGDAPSSSSSDGGGLDDRAEGNAPDDAAPIGDAAPDAPLAVGCTDASLTCDGGCTPNDDIRNCGACGHDCTNLSNVTGTVGCSSGACVFDAGACKPGTAHCSANPDDGCETDITMPSHCGGCTSACDAGAPLCAGSGSQYACATGCPPTAPTLCGGTTCVDTTSSTPNCKTCSAACTTAVAHATPTCTNSQCGFACTGSYPDPCAGKCVDFTSDSANCGGCGSACGPRQTCAASHCLCTSDPGCPSAGTFCSASTLTTCSTDSNGCVYKSASTTCTNGACTGAAGTASCCTNACMTGGTQCGGGGTQFCAALASGCMGWQTTACGTGLACETYAGPVCADPQWAEWPMPNDKVDVSLGAPHFESYTDNGDGTVTDIVTKLQWQQGSSATTYPRANAAAYCKGLSLGGHADWRLPTITELVSLLDFSPGGVTAYGSTISPMFASTPSTPFWSSTGYAGAPTVAWYAVFAQPDGGFTSPTSATDTTTAYNARCVR